MRVWRGLPPQASRRYQDVRNFPSWQWHIVRQRIAICRRGHQQLHLRKL